MAGEYSADDRRSEVREGTLGKRYGTRYQRRRSEHTVALMLGRWKTGRPLGRAPKKTGQPAHFAQWQRAAAELRGLEAGA